MLIPVIAEKDVAIALSAKSQFWKRFLTQNLTAFTLELTFCSKRAHLTNRITTMKTQLANGIDDNSLILEVPRINVVLMSLKHIKPR